MNRPSAAVTGAASGIGLAAATALARRGIPVLLGDLGAQRLTDARDRILSEVPDALVDVIEVDVSDPAQVDAFIAAGVGQQGRLGTLVTCAGIYRSAEVADLDAASWDAVADVNLRGTALCAAGAARHMRDTGGGSIVLTSSISSVVIEPGSAAYSATKAAINSLARSIAVDHSRHGIAANAVAPGWVATGMTADDLSRSFDTVNPLGRVATADEIADVVVWLALDAPRFLTGSTLFVDGGQTALAAVPG